MKKRFFVFLICSIFILNSAFSEVKAQQKDVSTVKTLLIEPIEFYEKSDHIVLNNTMFIYKFYKDTAGYNMIMCANNLTTYVWEENFNLQYLHQSGQWKFRGEPQNISWIIINDYWINVTRTYIDFEGTYYYVTYIVKSDMPVKVSVKVHSAQTDEYRMYWYIAGIVYPNWHNLTTGLRFGEITIPEAWIEFNWEDIYSNWGNITSSNVEDHAQGKKADIFFEVGEIQADENLTIDPSTVGTSTSGAPLNYVYGRGNFHHNGYHWVSYTDGTNIKLDADADGDYSSGAVSNTLRSGNWLTSQFDLVFDGTYLHYAFAQWDLYYRRGTPDNDGGITWSAVEQTALNEANVAYDYPSIEVDTSGYVYIAYRRKNTTDNTYRPYVVKNDNNDGTWTTSSGFPYELSSTETDKWRLISLSLTATKMYFTYCYGGHNNFGKLYTGSWGSQENIDDGENLYKEYGFSAITISDDIYFGFTVFSSYDLKMTKRTYGVGWGSAEMIYDADEYVFPSMSWDTATNDLYCFWANITSDKVLYVEKTGGSWDLTPTELADEGDIWGNDKLTAFASSFNSVIGLTWVNKSASPRDIRYGFLTLGQLFQRGATLSLSMGWVGTKVLTIKRSVALSLSMGLSSDRVLDYFRSADLPLSTGWVGTRVLTLARTVTLALSTGWSGTRVLILVRSADLSLSTSWAGTRILRFPRTATLALSTGWGATRQVNYTANPTMNLATSWIATWPVPVVVTGVDLWLMALLLVTPIGLGLAFIRKVPLIAFLCGMILILFAGYIAINPYVNTYYYYDSTEGVWHTRVELFPLHPYTEMIFLFLGVVIIVLASGQREL